jgi:hypothetical protein
MNLVSQSGKDETGAARRVRDGHHPKSATEERMARIDHLDLVGRLDHCLGLAQTCSIKLRPLSTECPFLPMP